MTVKIESRYAALSYPTLSSANSTCQANQLALQWSIITVAGSPKTLMLFAITVISLVSVQFTWFFWLAWDMFEEEPGFLATMIAVGVGGCWYGIAASRQKTIYRYKIFSTTARLVYAPYFSKHVKVIFKVVVFTAVFLLLLAGLMTNFLLFVIGPGGALLVLALRILTWEYPVTRDRSLPWHEYNFVTVDRKRRFVVTHVQDQTLGFEARLPNDDLLDAYLAFLRSTLPATAQFTEKKWNLSVI